MLLVHKYFQTQNDENRLVLRLMRGRSTGSLLSNYFSKLINISKRGVGVVEPRHEKTYFVHMRKHKGADQLYRTADQCLFSLHR